MKHRWWFPGGRIYHFETIYKAAKRKAREELGVILNPVQIVSIEESMFKGNKYKIHTINTVILMSPMKKKHSVQLDEHHTTFQWFETIPRHVHRCVRDPLLKYGFRLKNR
jgi:ADP-ribose pyrophosphatase YjhB (NUDIX family)